MKYVIALGGNAISSPSSIDKVAKEIVKRYLKGSSIVITHGNGPQVGELAKQQHRSLAILTSETQAWIGTTIKDRLNLALHKYKKDSDDVVEVVITEAIVDSKEYGFSNPKKPIGPFYNSKEAAEMRRQGLRVKKLIGGYRMVVPSPSPKKIVQIDRIKELLKDNKIVIACGGGGIPISRKSGKSNYINAVIDKDRASALLAKELHADMFFILTNVDGVYLNYKKKGQEFISRINAGRLRGYLKKGYFEEGSMDPKVESCIDFVMSRKKYAGIGNISNPAKVLSLKRLTLIVP